MSTVLVERRGRIAIVTVHRPDKLNALDADTITSLRETVLAQDADPTVGVVILTGAGPKSFVAGADIVGLSKQGVLDGRDNARHGQALTLAIETAKKPVLAAINGFALGGGLELALACDVRYASTNAKLGLPEVSLGIIPGYGGTQRLPRLIGMSKALEMMLTGDPIGAEDALRIGLVSAVFPPEQLMDGVIAVAERILSRGPTAVGLAKEAARRGVQLGLEAGLALEADLFGIISSTDEMREGMRAFLEKRKPDWK